MSSPKWGGNVRRGVSESVIRYHGKKTPNPLVNWIEAVSRGQSGSAFSREKKRVSKSGLGREVSLVMGGENLRKGLFAAEERTVAENTLHMGKHLLSSNSPKQHANFPPSERELKRNTHVGVPGRSRKDIDLREGHQKGAFLRRQPTMAKGIF